MTSGEPAATGAEIHDLSSDWRAHASELLRSKGRIAGTTRYERNVPPAVLKRALEVGMKTVRTRPPDGDGYAVPLHAEDDPTATAEYVLWRPDREQIGWYDTDFGIDGTVRYVSLATAAETTIGSRLRFWHPDFSAEPDDELSDLELPHRTVEPSSTLPADDVFEGLTATVERARDAERRSNRQRYRNESLATLIQRGIASGPFVSVGWTADGDDLQLQLASDSGTADVDLHRDEGIHPGNLFLIDTREADPSFPVVGEVSAVEDLTMTVRLEWEDVDDRAAVEATLEDGTREFWATLLLNPVPFDRRIDAIRSVESQPSKRNLLTGDRPVRFSVDRHAIPSPAMELNRYQRQALKWAADAEDVLCIHGPPGTGKTRTLTAYVKHAVRRGESVLVTSHSNQAVDNLLVGDSTVDDPEPGTLHAAACGTSGGDGEDDVDLSIARVGRNSKNDVVQRHYRGRSVDGADVVAATTNAAAQFETDRFDVAVVDEATQASRPATAIVLDCAERLLLSGDHKQLPPYSAAEPAAETGQRISLFEHLVDRYGDDVRVLLKRQYRMNETIAAFPNRAFYGGRLETADRNHEWRVADLAPLVGIDVSGEERREPGGHSFYNPAEAAVVVREVGRLVEAGVSPEDVGVISAYSGQIGRIRSRLDGSDVDDAGQVTVDTVDSFQGGERDVIVISFVRSNDEGRSGFLETPEEGPRRLNVALTRARKRLVLVGDWETLATPSPDRSPDESCADLYDDLEAYVRERGEFSFGTQSSGGNPQL
ncbi:AAA domain-containing protein [Halomicrococcus gelatinilyticus]|uniref:AAA domain-containing protein n=1 Tax=Halomicrococcus gelatinilyticus TaxID=1702103 RepID=UPI002E10426A